MISRRVGHTPVPEIEATCRYGIKFYVLSNEDAFPFIWLTPIGKNENEIFKAAKYMRKHVK